MQSSSAEPEKEEKELKEGNIGEATGVLGEGKKEIEVCLIGEGSKREGLKLCM